MPLTDTAVRNAKPKDKPYKLGDTGGLFLLVQPSGGRLWRLKYRLDGREKKLGIGTYPEVSLSEARKRRDQARELIANGRDPSREKQLAKQRAVVSAGNTFGEIAAEFIDKRRREGMASDLHPEFWIVLSWKIPVMIGGPGYGVNDEEDEVFGGADRLRAEAG